MHIYLNPPRAFWQIPETNITLMRTQPLREISEVELSELSGEQRSILSKSLQTGVVREIPDSSPLLSLSETGDIDILALSAAEIQRKHISRIIMLGKAGLEELNALSEREKTRPSPRKDVLTIIDFAIERIRLLNPETLEEKFYKEIELIEDVIEPTVPTETAKKKGRTRMNKLTNMETN